MGRRILITGGAGFIGSHVCERCLHRGWSVDVVDNLSTGRREQVPAGAALHELDIRAPEAAALLEDHAFDAIVHLAAQMDVRRSVADPVHDAGVNVLGTLNLLEALRRSGRMSTTRVVFASTGGALYGDAATPPNAETTAKEPESPYAISKLAAEYYLTYYGRLHGLANVALRFGNVYGPRQDPHGEAGVVAIFCGRLLEGRPLTIYGDGTQTRDYVFVGDVAAATVVAIESALPAAGSLDARAFNVGTGVATSVNELAAVLLDVAGLRNPIEYAARRAGEQEHSFLDAARAARTLRFRASTDLRAGLRETFQWFEARALTQSSQP